MERSERAHIILFEQQRADEPDYRLIVWKDADHFGASFELAVETLDGMDAVKFDPMLLGKVMSASTSLSASSIRLASLGTFGLI
ncbi:hypothetical protein M2315_005265 [Agrobacterium fabrum]|nr:hypothetical protein [Agrobacterium fabrum]